jgi:hypothetical protein
VQLELETIDWNRRGSQKEEEEVAVRVMAIANDKNDRISNCVHSPFGRHFDLL